MHYQNFGEVAMDPIFFNSWLCKCFETSIKKGGGGEGWIMYYFL